MNSQDFVYGDGEIVTASFEKDGEIIRVTVGEKQFELRPVGTNLYATTINGARSHLAVVKSKGVYYIDFDSVLLEVKEPSDLGVAGGAGDHGAEKDKIYAPMPGKVVKIMVAEGDRVDDKQPMVIVEAMKMENQVNAKAKGTVKAINFAEGDQVDTESPIIELELEE